MDDQEKKDQVVIDDTPEVEEQEFDIEGLSDQEVNMAKDHGLYKEPEEQVEEKQEEEQEDGEHDEQSEPKTDEDSDKEEKTEEEEIDTDPSNFEKMDEVFEKNESKFHEKFTSNAKALYFKNKVEKKKRQEAQKERDELREKLDTLKDSSLSQKKIDKITKLLREDTDNLTIEALNGIINEQVEVKEEPTVDTGNLQQKVAAKVTFAEKMGRSQYEDFDDLVKLAGEVFNTKTRYQKQFDLMLTDDNIDELEIVDFVVDIAKLNKNYGKKEINPTVKKKVDRVLNNSKKKVSSASVSGAGGRRVVSEDELTCADAHKLPLAQWSKLKDSTRQRILQGIDP
ncbi:MAG: hypothetical protein GY861_16905 [bacterium]|nr:hypothetical protein [bacterium]